MFGVETLKEKVKVKIKDGDDIFFKKYDAKDVTIVKDVEKEEEFLGVENIEDLKQLKELEKLEKLEKTEKNDEI